MREVKVWDVAVRAFHWSLGALVLVAFLTADSDEAIAWHTLAGMAIAGLLVFRVIWGFVGPAPARFRSFVKGPREVLAYLRDYVKGRPPRHLSHNPLGAVMVVGFLGVLFLTVATGALAYGGAEWDGPFSAFIGEGLGHDLEEVHEALAGSLLVLVPAHVLGVIVSSFLERQNLVKGMITGRKLAVDDAGGYERPRLPRLLAALTLGAALAWGLFQLLRPGVAEAEAGVRSTAAASPSPEASWREECGACHLAYPPGLLPAASWRKLMAGLDDHFGEEARMTPEVEATIEGWLVSNAAETGSNGKSRSILRSLRGDAPLRISEVPYVRRQHRELKASVFERPSIESRANCEACHSGAEKGSFRKHKVPKS